MLIPLHCYPQVRGEQEVLWSMSYEVQALKPAQSLLAIGLWMSHFPSMRLSFLFWVGQRISPPFQSFNEDYRNDQNFTHHLHMLNPHLGNLDTDKIELVDRQLLARRRGDVSPIRTKKPRWEISLLKNLVQRRKWPVRASLNQGRYCLYLQQRNVEG